MKVVLLSDIKGCGKKGDIANVSDGYARNFLLPKKLAKEADASALNEIKNAENAKKHKIEVETNKAKKSAEKLNEKTLKIIALAGKGGRLFGSITAKELSEKIEENFGIKVDKRKIKINSDIKNFGTYEIEVKLYTGISSKMFVLVTDA